MRLSSVYKLFILIQRISVFTHGIILVCFGCCLFFSPVNAQRGKDGPKIISASNSVVNDYTFLLANASSGNIFLSVSGSSINSAGLFSAPLSSGDLIMIIQMQGATIKIINDSTYGEILNYNNCGNYEFCEVASVPNANTITLNVPLQHNYTAAGKVQVVRVPRYSSLIIDSSFGVSCSAWNGATGGIAAIEVFGNTFLIGSGKIDVTGKGFRGGILNENLATYGPINFYGALGDLGAEKGESISGFETSYDALGGRYCRGAPANGGGGGNAHNAGGGGGANGGDLNLYTGKGCPDVSDTNWIGAWNLEFSGMSNLISSGGGRGGYTYSFLNLNALVTGPNNSDWSGDNRNSFGGLGGRPLDYTTGKIFIGGGGGAGDQNDNSGGKGGNAGGIIFLLNSGIVSGSGQFIANGEAGANTTLGTGDGAGGGGGGGTIIINSIGAISGISIAANGGKGGDQILPLLSQEAEGPGGGGGGGYIAVSNGALVKTGLGGKNGTTNSMCLTEFPPNGATKGGSGVTDGVISDFYLITNDIIICSGDSAILSVSAAGTVPPGIIFGWYNTASGGTLLGFGNTFTTPKLDTSITYYAGSYPGRYREAVHVNVDVVQTNFSATSECIGTATTFISTAGTSLGTVLTWSWNFGDGIGNSSLQNPVYNYASPSAYTVVLHVIDNLGCTQSDTQNVIVNPVPAINFSSNVTSGCGQVTAQFSNNTTNGNTYQWNFGDGINSSQITPSHIYNIPGEYTVTLTAISIHGCAAIDSIIGMITVNAKPIAAFTASDICLGDMAAFINLSDGNGAALSSTDWNFGDGSGTSAGFSPTYLYANAGTFNAELIVSNTSGCSDTSTHQVTVNPSPVVHFTTGSQSACDSLSVQLINNTTDASTYLWHFGDGDTSVQINPFHLYDEPGTYTISLTAISVNGCVRSLSILNMITIYASPIVNFSGSQMNLCKHDCTGFQDLSSGLNSSWSWSFPGGSPSLFSGQFPSAICYDSVGIYPVTLHVSNGFCSSQQTINNYISVLNCVQPHADFYTTDTTICSGSCINFISTSSNVINYDWHFPGATPSLSPDVNPVNICYQNPGDYDVTLITSNSLTSDTLSMPRLVHVYALPTSPVIFQHSDTLLIATTAAHYQWYYESVAISNSDNQFYLAILPGNYFAEITDSSGCKAFSRVYYFSLVGITVIGEAGKLSIYPNPASDFLNIKISSTEKDEVKIKIETILGTTLVERSINVVHGVTVFSIDVSNLASGIYFITLETSKGNRVEKFTRQ